MNHYNYCGSWYHCNITRHIAIHKCITACKQDLFVILLEAANFVSEMAT